MKIIFVFLYVMINNIFSSPEKLDDFKANQKRFPRVRLAYSEKEDLIISKLKAVNLALNELNILIIAYKAEGQLELWVKSKKASNYTLLETFKICNSSGKLGPKRKEGDYQVPEGFYYIDRFNPASNYYLSLGINYPNKSDKLKSKFTNLGGDIFIHGECETIGCLPMTNDKIKEIYLYAIEAKNAGQDQIPVYIFPSRLTEPAYDILKNEHQNDPELINLWSSLKTGYDQFFVSKKEIEFHINDKGDYLVGMRE